MVSSTEPCLASGSGYISAYHGSFLSPAGLRGVKSPRQKMKGGEEGERERERNRETQRDRDTETER